MFNEVEFIVDVVDGMVVNMEYHENMSGHYSYGLNSGRPFDSPTSVKLSIKERQISMPSRLHEHSLTGEPINLMAIRNEVCMFVLRDVRLAKRSTLMNEDYTENEYIGMATDVTRMFTFKKP